MVLRIDSVKNLSGIKAVFSFVFLFHLKRTERFLVNFNHYMIHKKAVTVLCQVGTDKFLKFHVS